MLDVFFVMAASGALNSPPLVHAESRIHVGDPIPDNAPSESWSCPAVPGHMVSFSLRIENGRVFYKSPLHPSFSGPDGDVITKVEWKVVSNTTLGVVIVSPSNDVVAGNRHLGGGMIALDRQTGDVVFSQTLVGNKSNFVAEGSCTRDYRLPGSF